jgi:hypothetical protein
MANNAVSTAHGTTSQMSTTTRSQRINRPETDQYEQKGLKGQLARRLFQLVAEFGSGNGQGTAAGRV